MKSRNSENIIEVEQLDSDIQVISLMKFCSTKASKDTADAQEFDIEIMDEHLNDGIINETNEIIIKQDNNVVKECCIWIKEGSLPLLTEEDPLRLTKEIEKAEAEIINSDIENIDQPISLSSPPNSPIKTETIRLLSPSNSPIKTEAVIARKSTRPRTAKVITDYDYGSTSDWPSPRPSLKTSRANKFRRKISYKYGELEEFSTSENERISEGKFSDSSGSLISEDSSSNRLTHSKEPFKRVSSRNRIPTKKCCQSCSDTTPISTELSCSYSQMSRSRNRIMEGKLRKSNVKKVRTSSVNDDLPKMPPIENKSFHFDENSTSNISIQECSTDSEEGSIIFVDNEPACSEVPQSTVSIRNRTIKTPTKTCYQSCSSNTDKNNCDLQADYRLKKSPRLLKAKFKRKIVNYKTIEQISLHNHTEQMRRAELNRLFKELKATLPATQYDNNASKNFILNAALKYINELTFESKYIDKQMNFLLTENKRLNDVLKKKREEAS